MITENLSTLKIHKLTQDQYDRELLAGNIDENALYLTPDEENSQSTKDIFETKEVSGTTIAVDDSAKAPIASLKLYGKTTQNSTPTPDNPIELKSVGDSGSYSVDLYGKNLCDIIMNIPGSSGNSNTYDATTHTITLNADAISDGTGRYFYPFKNFEIGKAYTLSFDIKGTAGKKVRCGWNSKKYITIALTNQFTRYSMTLTATKNAEAIIFYSMETANGGLASGEYMQFANVQIEEGTQATPYEPYKAKQSITFTDTLRGVGDIKDEVDFTRGAKIQNIGKYTINGTEEYFHFTQDGINQFYGIKPSLAPKYIKGKISVISDKFKGIPVENRVNNYDTVYVALRYNTDENSAVFCFNLPSNITTVEEAKEYVLGTTLYYVLYEPIETPIPEEELNAYRQLHTNKPNTTIISEADMEVDYVVDSTSAEYIENRLEEVEDTIPTKISQLENDANYIKDVSLSQLGVTATATELNTLDGITATTTELNYVDGVTSNIQTQLNGKAASSHTHNYAGSSSAGGAATTALTCTGNAASSTYGKRLYTPSIATTAGTTYTIDTYLTLIKNTLPLETQGYYTWKHSWSYAGNGLLSATIGSTTHKIQLAGAHCEFNGSSSGEYVLRITTATASGTSGASFTAGATYQYNYHGATYSPIWTIDNAIVGLSVNGKTITYTKNNGTTGTITTQDTNTTYDAATQSANGLMSASDKKKLDGIPSDTQTQLNGKSSSDHTHNIIQPIDTRYVNTAPANVPKGLSLHLKANGYDGLNEGYAYHPTLMMNAWGDKSGGPWGELALTTNNNLWFRTSVYDSDTDWKAWRRVTTMDLLWANPDPYSPFAGQIISLPEVANYSVFMITAVPWCYDGGNRNLITFKNSGTTFTEAVYWQNTWYSIQRGFTIKDDSVVIGDGTNLDMIQNERYVPWYIHGLSF